MAKTHYQIIASGVVIRVSKKQWEDKLHYVKTTRWFIPADNPSVDNMFYHVNRDRKVEGFIIFSTYEGE